MYLFKIKAKQTKGTPARSEVRAVSTTTTVRLPIAPLDRAPLLGQLEWRRAMLAQRDIIEFKVSEAFHFI